MAADGLPVRGRLQWDLPAKINYIHKNEDDKESLDAVLELACFVKPPRMCFDNVKIGTTSFRTLKIFNPGVERETVVLEKFPNVEAGFAIVGLTEEDSLCLDLEPQEEVSIKFSWQPLVAGNSRHLAVFKWVGGQKLQVIILASCYDPNPKKKKGRRLPMRKALQPSDRPNIPLKVASSAKENLINAAKTKGQESPNVKNLVEIGPDTPSRRSTFNVFQSILTDKENREDEKENELLISNKPLCNRPTFNVEKDSCLSGELGSYERGSLERSQPGLKTEQTKEELIRFEEKIRNKNDENAYDDLGVVECNTFHNTFHESEIRLSSSPIRWYHPGYFTSSKSKSDLHPGQVIMNGEMKHAFIPYPSFDNTDTFLNMEMSTANKHKAALHEESLSFGSAASSLFTLTREEKFAQHLESVQESPSVYATPKGGMSESKTLTNENVGNITTSNAVVIVKEETNGNGTFRLACKGIDAVDGKEKHPIGDFDDKWAGKDQESEYCGEDESTIRASIGTMIKVPTALTTVKEEFNTTDDVKPLISFALEEEKNDQGTVQHAAKKGVIERCQIASEDANVKSSTEGKEARLNVEENEDGDVDEKNGPSKISNTSAFSETSKREAFQHAKRNTAKASAKLTEKKVAPKKEASQKPAKKIDLKVNKKKEGEKAVQSRYLTSHHKPKEILPKKGRESLDGNTKKKGNVIDAKFKAVILPQKRASGTGDASSDMVKPAIAMKRLKLIKPKHEKIAKHPMPYAAKNMFYDERWIEKQERGFKNWLNFVLTPPDDDDADDQTIDECKRGKLALESESHQPVAPTKEMLSFRMYAARRRMAKLRRDACFLYQCDQMAALIHKLEREIEHGRLAIRADRHVDADLGVRKHIADMLLSFNPLWLRIGLEVVFGEIIPMQNNNDVASLSRFIHRRLLGNPDIAVEYSHPSVPGLFKAGYVEALGKFTLKKLLLVIVFLDKAKNSRLISHDPCLFNKDSQFKSIRDMLLMFSRDYLHREGDIVKHLTYLGYSVSHTQMPLHEFDFGVNCLAVDLRDGLRLVRVVELLTKNWSLSSRLRVPAVSRLQKVHNVELAFKGLKETNMDIQNVANIDARYIVDGHREKTLLLLWQIIFHFQVDVLLEETKLKHEIKHLEKSKRLMLDYKYLHQGDGALENRRKSLENNLGFKSEKLKLLFQWCRLVGELHGVQIENFTVSFSDGRAFCYLLHHYHPALLSKDAIRNDTSVTCTMSQEEGDDIDDSLVYQNWIKPGSTCDRANSKLGKLLLNEKENFSLFCEKVKEIGASPAMVLASDMSNTIPDEKVVIAYLSFLCTRLLDLREEIKAARCIQVAWRHHRLRNERRRHQVIKEAAIKLQAVVRGFLTRKKVKDMQTAAVKIQANWRGYRQRCHVERAKHLKESKEKDVAVRKIQTMVRGFLCRRKLKSQKMSVLLLQRAIREYLCRRRQKLRKSAAITIQRRFIANRLARMEREKYLEMKNAVVKIQRAYRKHHQICVKEKCTAAIQIQSVWRMYCERKAYAKKKIAAICLQKFWRGYVCRKLSQKRTASIVVLQTRLRAYLIGSRVREDYLRKREAALLIQRRFRNHIIKKKKAQLRACLCLQSHFRSFQCRQQYTKLRNASVKLQAHFRRKQCQRNYAKLKAAVLSLQRIRRSLLMAKEARDKFQDLKQSCLSVQAIYRGKRFRRDFIELKKNVVKMQALWRGKASRKTYIAKKNAVLTIENAFIRKKKTITLRAEFVAMRNICIKIQAAFRGAKQRATFLELKNSAIRMQALIRGNIQRKKFLLIKKNAVLIQRQFRGMKAGNQTRDTYQRMKSNCIKIQLWYRGEREKNRYQSLKRAAVVCQSTYRCSKAVKELEKIKAAALVIQRRYRAMRKAHAAQVHYLITKAAIITIQSAYRGVVVRRALMRQNAAAGRIQSLFKMHKAKAEFCKMREAAICIQNRYRATISAQATMNEFKKLRSAVITLQSIARGFLVRKRLKKVKLAAVTLQASYKAYKQRQTFKAMRISAIIIQKNSRALLCRMKYLAMKNAAVKMQILYKGNLKTKEAVKEYQKKRAAAITLQSAVRGFQTRKSLQERRAATKLQAVVKSYLQRKRYVLFKSTVIKLQKLVRSNIERRRREKAAVCLQQHWKAYVLGRSIHNHYLKQRKACIILQSMVRKLIAVKAFADHKDAALVIQRRFRAQRLMQCEQRAFKKLRKNTVMIQSAYRMCYARKEFTRKRNAVIHLQKCTRKILRQRRIEKLSKAAVIIQRRYKATKDMKAERSSFLRKRRCAILLQAHFRCIFARRQFSSILQATVQIQAWYRMVTSRGEYLKKRNSVIVIQRRYRAFVACQVDSACFHIMRGAVITIQATVKGYLARKHFMQKREAVIMLQTAYRRHLCQKRYQSLRNAVIKVQRRLRANAAANAARTDYLRKRSAAAILQSAYRRHRELKKTAIFIQARVRMLRDRRAFVAMRNSCLILQRFYREYLRRKRAAIVLQSHWKMRKAKRDYSMKLDAAVKIQSVIRMHLAKRNYLLQQGAALAIQIHYRAYLVGSLERLRYIAAKQSCIAIQATVRMWIHRRRFVMLRQKTLLIQKRVRAQIVMKNQRCAFLRQKAAAVVIQSSFHGYKARVFAKWLRKQKVIEEYLRLVEERKIALQRNSAATVIQKNFRRSKARKSFLLQKDSAVKIQKYYRGHLLTERIRRDYLLKVSNINLIQRAYRRYQSRKLHVVLKEERDRRNKAATRIQATFKALNERKIFLKKKAVAIGIQRCFKGIVYRRKFVKELELMNENATKIQSAYRSYAARKTLLYLQNERREQTNAAIVLQSCIRGYIARRDYRTLKRATILIQQTYRSIVLIKDSRHRYLCIKRSVLKIQATYRMYLAKKEFRRCAAIKKLRGDSAVVIQRLFRGYRKMNECRDEFNKQRAGAIAIQRRFREIRDRKMKLKVKAAIVIQRAYRSYQGKKISHRQLAAMKIQTAFRRYKHHQSYQQLRKHTTYIQRRVRQVLRRKLNARVETAAVMIQRWYRSAVVMKKDRVTYLRMKEAAIRIQSFWKGYLVRKAVVDRKVIRARERIESANSEATEPKKLCNRTKSALSYLLNCRNVSTIYEALRNLEVSTRLSNKCCERLVEDNALEVIFQIMRNCNRSLPSIEQIHMALCVLINLSKCPTTYMAIGGEKDALLHIADLMVNFREKKKIFPYCCTLLAILCQDFSILKSIEKNQVLAKKLKGVDNLINRKAQVELKRAISKIKTNKTALAKEGKDTFTIMEQLNSIKVLKGVLSLL